MPFESCESVVSAASSLLGALIGAGAAIGASFFAEHLKQQAEKRAEKHSYLSHLKFACQEVCYYKLKTVVLRCHAEKLIKEYPKTPLFGLQTFAIFPELLERSKMWMAERGKSLELITHVSDCHFELCRIRNSLDLCKRLADSRGVSPPTLDEIKPLLNDLIDRIKYGDIRFNEAIGALDSEIRGYEPDEVQIPQSQPISTI
ncbi:MAG: hypothetical protein V4599_01785 [Verrucomicrobiota bacterium]